jgi:CheY-like chemotaxis protein
MTFILILMAIVLTGVAAGVFSIHRTLSKLLKNQSRAAAPLLDKGIDSPASSSCAAHRAVHDLNNLLGTIRGFTDAAMEDLSASSPLRSDLTEILEASDRAQSLITSLKRDSKLCAAKKSPADTALQNTPRCPSSPVGSFERRSSPATEPDTTRQSSAVEKPLTLQSSIQTASPLKEKPFETVPKKPSAERSRKPEQKHLLIVDDETQLLAMFRRIFEPQGYHVTTFSNGLTAWDDFRKNADTYDLAILDQRMPEISGTSLAAEMLHYRPDFPIILLTGFSDTTGPDDAAQLGIRKFLSKPIPQNELSDTIRKTLGEPEYLAT